MKDKIYEEGFRPDEKVAEAFSDLVAIVSQLRRDCPWDREQTHDSIKHLLIEEAYETVEAVDEENWTELGKELGDILLHVVFHAEIASETPSFSLIDVIRAETDKLVRRHPHVFSNVEVTGVGDVLTNWESIKIREGEKKSAMEGVPRNLPTLLRAFRMQEKAAGVGFDFPDVESAWVKVREELGEFEASLSQKSSIEEQEEEFGDLLFALVNYSRLKGINPENALGRTNSKFIRRFQHIEGRLEEEGQSIVDASLSEMDVYWEEAKDLEAAGDL
jgi:MazG family protein